MSHRQNNIVLVGVGVRVLRRDEGVERAMVFHRIFVVSEGLLAIIAASQIKTKGVRRKLCIDNADQEHKVKSL